jgi:hypothetical protein
VIYFLQSATRSQAVDSADKLILAVRRRSLGVRRGSSAKGGQAPLVRGGASEERFIVPFSESQSRPHCCKPPIHHRPGPLSPPSRSLPRWHLPKSPFRLSTTDTITSTSTRRSHDDSPPYPSPPPLHPFSSSSSLASRGHRRHSTHGTLDSHSLGSGSTPFVIRPADLLSTIPFYSQ